MSTWLTEAAADKLRNELLGAALDQWEAEDGPFTQAEQWRAEGHQDPGGSLMTGYGHAHTAQ